jgi:hypothetical protein
MNSRRFDTLARRLATGVDRRALLRGAAGLAGAATLGVSAVEEAEASRLPSNCKRFILAAGDKPTKQFKHIDDDVQIILKPKGSGNPRVLLDDHNGTPNGANGAHFHPLEFNAKIGDRIQVIGTNAQGPKCELDEMYLFCATGQNKKKGVKLMDHYTCSRNEGQRTGKFFDKTFRIR